MINIEYQDMIDQNMADEEITMQDEMETELQIQIYQDHEEYIFND